ncbi:1-acyl-sn-glycerol-3-phosphate acyltransferase [Enterobacteriaceae bacterium H20N1]|uniref:1-acyl-sn-glycerol-3-phosphate acyltransferase n=1 Tax=Dryocola boscaweniae TaxID=2925397 RepID=A0A9X2WBH3_9ENTR|nr:lysophospholipid acyltransferase family protein [Dryocola boscaweniae]MCT4704282.1 1-acyl-sn-glycerol-3-phosphate acyltransferase [Dryocola boscaweniae]MCT4721450.1 1-acyl-sn-glycerol-3-phosphate acyltransferase [Dryocola boscaweniae]
MWRKCLERLNWCWRVVMTGGLFVLFGAGGLALSLLWFNLLLLAVPDKNKRRNIARRSIAASFRLFLRIGRFLGVFDYQFSGAENLRSDKGCLVVANHPTLLDYVFIASQTPEIGCLVKASLVNNPCFKGVIRAADYLINSQGETLLPESQRRLSVGETILIFPEGTRTRPGEPLAIQRGAAQIAVRSGCPLRLVHIYCDRRYLDKQSRWYQVPARKPMITVSVQQRIESLDFMTAQDEAPTLAARRLSHYLRQELVPDPR